MPREMPLHYVRGHWKDYRNGRGLFGKYHGLYFIPEHRRGDEDNGTNWHEYHL